MRKKIRQDRDALKSQGTPQADENARHTFREFLVAQRLNLSGFCLEYGKKLEGQTPDWYDEEKRLLLEVFTCERGGKSNPVQRVGAKIAEKVAKYGKAVANKALFFVVAVYGDFYSGFDSPDECEQAIRDGRLFETYPDLSGVVFFTESDGLKVRQIDGSTKPKQQYLFKYFANPNAIRQIDLTASLGCCD